MASSVSRKRSPTELTARPDNGLGGRNLRKCFVRTFSDGAFSFDTFDETVIDLRIFYRTNEGGSMKNMRQISSNTLPNGGASLRPGPSGVGVT